MKKMNLAKSLATAQTHSQAQFAGQGRPSKAELAARTEKGVAARTKSPVAKPKAKPIKRVQSIREIFSYSADDAARLERLIKRAARIGQLSNKSEVVRAGLQALDGLSDEQLIKALQAVPRLKPGRPKQTAPTA